MHTRQYRSGFQHKGWIATILALSIFTFLVSTAAAKGGLSKLRIRVRPVEAEIFIDGEHMGDASWDGSLEVPDIGPGEHTVGVYNYGYTPQTFKLNFEAGHAQYLEVVLEPLPGTVSGSWGQIDVHGAHRAAILLNGKTMEYEVAHGGESHGRFSSRLIVPPGTYQLSLVHGDKTIWSGPVTVEAGKRTVVHAEKGTTETQNWHGHEPGNDVPRFHAATTRTTVAVEPVKANFSSTSATIACGDSAQLTWSSTGAVHDEISGVGPVAASGTQTVNPAATTTYTLTATGPGGVATPTATVTVNNNIDASLTVSPAEVTYERVGNKVTQQGTATVSWSATDGHPLTVTVDPFGSNDATGSRQVTPEPTQTGNGPVDQTITYTLHATNPCGGDVTRTATLHVTGVIKPGGVTETFEEFTEVSLVSLYYPTNWPTKEHPEGGLLKSQQEALMTIAKSFKDFQQQDPNARLVLEAHADIRGSGDHNKDLTERRAARVKDFLVAQGIAASSIDSVAVGKESQLGKDEVKDLEAKNPHTPPPARLKAADDDWMAYNRRVDVLVQPLGLHSSRYYPHQAPDSSVLWLKQSPTWKVIQKNQ
ncbi:MAG: OmpA family protein [Terriglobia bacterium]